METQQTSHQHVSSLQLKCHRSSSNLHCGQDIQKQSCAAENLWNPCHSTHFFFKHTGKATNATSELSTCKTYLVLFMNPQRRKTQTLSKSLYFLCKIKLNPNKKPQVSMESGIPGPRPCTYKLKSNKQCNPSPSWPMSETVTVWHILVSIHLSLYLCKENPPTKGTEEIKVHLCCCDPFTWQEGTAEGMFCLSQWFSPQSNCTTTAQSLDRNTRQYNSKVCTCKLAYDTFLTTMGRQCM